MRTVRPIGWTDEKRQIEESLNERTAEIERHNEYLSGIVEREVGGARSRLKPRTNNLLALRLEAAFALRVGAIRVRRLSTFKTKRHIESRRTPSTDGAPRSHLTTMSVILS